VLIREGEPGRRFVVIVEGSVEVTKGGEKVDIRGGTEFFGEMSLLSSAPTNATVTATSAGRALAITDEDFQRLLRQSPEIEEQVRHSLEQRLAPEVLSGLTFWMEQAPTEFTPTEPPPSVL
jgi:CRP-like cAMP-binding protein